MDPRKAELLHLLLAEQVLEFGAFTLKSGRQSPYFFNLGKLSSASGLRILAAGYRARLEAAELNPQVLFGPAYKGIPLVAAVALDWAAEGKNLGIAYNRKEVKQHGEGGVLVGASLDGARVVLLDDVLTAGTALRQAADLIQAAGGRLEGVVIALDRQERVVVERPRTSAVSALAADLGVPVFSLLCLDDVLRFVEQNANLVVEIAGLDQSVLHERLLDYRNEYCVT